MGKSDAGAQVKKILQKVCDGVKRAYQIICPILSQLWAVIYSSRKLLLSIPVVAAAVFLARYSQEKLPSMVGIWLKDDGSYLLMASRSQVIWGCLGVTGACLLMMYCSRRTLYPWLISIFTMVLPLLILLTNVFPA